MGNKIKYYVESMRLRTLPLSISGIILGSLVAAAHGFWDFGIFTWALLTAVILQIISNIANELGDLQKGTDNEQRLGPIRSVQSGNLTERELKKMLILFVLSSMVSGLFLIERSFNSLFILPSYTMIFLGALAIIAAIKYTFGSKSYGYIGLGDAFVFLFFGIVSVVGAYYLMTKNIDFSTLLPASSVGFLSTAMLNQNNMRDIENDMNFEKKTMAVRMGLKSTKIYHLIIIASAFILMTIYCALQNVNPVGYLFLVTLPLFVWHLVYVLKNDGRSLDKHMKVIALGTVLFAVLGGIGLLLSREIDLSNNILMQ
ncbi:MAG: 1,4-dihydroxy-2-naphthoate octaprenyltransferase [Porphyromonadaceae bacterium]|nr:1,4-dihydroxy-2-naphthoate octaprenyltransferase [Porphyromonadaceae bacterium]